MGSCINLRVLLVVVLSSCFLSSLPLFACADSSTGIEGASGSSEMEQGSQDLDLSMAASFPVIGKFPNRRLLACSRSDVSLSQGQSGKTSSGIPIFSVQIINLCSSCVRNVHVACGNFASAILVNPNTFRRIAYNDCLVNNGNPIYSGNAIYFQYAQSSKYSMSVSTVTTC